MSRARATALILVNWRGVFFERYLLDRHVTALEGANGAGKTTVMIGAYVVLLPDLTRLKFTNLGETGATGGDRGIYGRLGEPGPSYAALEIDIDGRQRIVAAVYLERKAPPALTLTPFILSELADELAAHRIFLREADAHEHVATMADIEEAAGASRAKLEVFGSAKDYFGALFERGVSPLRLGLDEERNKFNDMLRTSMTGGISRTLTSDLRSFLFKQQTGLFDTLTRMRKNLDACRRTRIEVSEARVLEHEINGIYSAGYAMMAAALDGTRSKAAEHREAARKAEALLASERAQLEELATLLCEAESRAESLGPRLERARAAEGAARERLAELTRALAAAERLARLETERSRLLPDVEAALAARQQAAAARELARAQRDAAQHTLARAAAGLASLQAGLEELHRQAHAHGRVRDRLASAQLALAAVAEHAAALGAPEAGALAELEALERALAGALSATSGAPLDPSSLAPELLAHGQLQIETALRALDAARAEQDRRAELAERRRQEHAEARAALALLCGEPVAQGAGARARHELARLNELTLLGARQEELAQSSLEARALAERQRRVRAEASALGLAAGTGAADFMRELAALDAEWLRANERWREHEAAAQELAERGEALAATELALGARLESYGKLATLAARLAATGLTLPETRAELAASLRASHEARRALALRAEELREERRAALELAQRYEAMGGGVPEELSRLAELVDGQLLSARYEDLELDEARRTQAELGPLLHAIVVEDLPRALELALAEAGSQRAPGDVWLLEAGAAVPGIPAGPAPPSTPRQGALAELLAAAARDPEAPALVDLGHGVRVSRLPQEVSLGRAARRRRAEAARAEAETAGAALGSLEARGREQDAVTRDLESLQEHWELWAQGDPRPELERLGANRAELAGRREAELGAAREQRVAIARLGARRDALRALLPEHMLLDPPDHAERAERARGLLESARGAAAELARVSDARRILIARVHELDEPPPDAASVEALRRRTPALEAQRDRLFSAAEALGIANRERAALGFAHAARALTERTELVPELEAQHERALEGLAAAQRGLDQAESRWDQATVAAQRSEAALAALDAHLSRARGELGADAALELSADVVSAARDDLDARAAVLDELLREASGVDAQRSLARERAGEADKRLAAAQALAEAERRAAAPSEAAWRALRTAAEAARATEPDLSLEASPPVPSSQRFLEAESKRELMLDRLSSARGGAELGAALAAQRPSPSGDGGLGQFYLGAWLEVRAWLLRRLPAQIAELGEPLLGLGRLRADLSELEGRLTRQEGELRGTSADVARSIDVQLRRAGAQVKRLCRALEGVRFGSIQGMRVQLARVEKMDQVLAALREGKTQELLFQSNLPIEEALDEIFKRHAGGRTGGQKLIDYREYLELWVEIQRRSEQKWERVNPSQVSTGEAIGVGAALMMVILAEWERDDQLLRQKRAFGSLRFLFLDEANRLSQDNLGVLFDLCKVLDLQLLIAAPEVARAEGNTTYRLVRRISDDGLEEVLVTGRRATLPGAVELDEDLATAGAELDPVCAPEPAPAAPPRAPAPAEQLGLLD